MKKSKINIWTIVIIGVVIFFFFRVIRENYDSTFPGGSMNLLEVDIDSTNTMTLIMTFGFEPALDPTSPNLPIVYPTLSFVTVTDTNGNVYTLSPSRPKSAPRSSPIDATFDVSLPSNIDRNSVRSVSATGFISFQTSTTTTNTPALSDTTTNVKIV